MQEIPEDLPGREDLAAKICQQAFVLTPPKTPITMAPTKLEHVTIDGQGLRGGYSRKPGNLILNWEKLLKLVPDLALSAAGLSGPVWLVPFVGLHIWSSLRSEARVEIDPNHAIALLAMWQNRDARNEIGEAEAFAATQRALSKAGMSPVSELQFGAIVDHLITLDCIMLQGGVIWLMESVSATY